MSQELKPWIEGKTNNPKRALLGITSKMVAPGLILSVTVTRRRSLWLVKIFKVPAVTHLNNQPMFESITEEEVRGLL